MTMSNQMSLSAASVAVMANNNTLENIGAMQESFFELDGSTIHAGLEATNSQAAAEEKNIIDGADATRINAGCQMGGSILSMAATGYGMYAGYSANKQAEALETPGTGLQVGLKEITAEPGTEMKNLSPSSPTLPVEPVPSSQAAKITGELDSPAETSAAKVQAQLDTSTIPEDDSQASDAQKTLNAKEANAAEGTKKATTAAEEAKQNAEKLRTSAKTSSEMIGSFGSSMGSVITSSSGFASYDTTVDQAKQAKTRDLEQGLASALNSQTSLIGSQLSLLDQARGNTYQLMSTLQHVQG